MSVPSIAEFFLFLRQDLSLSLPAVKGCWAALNHVFSLTGMDLAASSIASYVSKFREVVSALGDMTSRLELVSLSQVFFQAFF